MNFGRHPLMLLCADVARARDFYVEHLGLKVNADIGWFVGLEHPDKPREVFEMSLCQHDHSSLPPSLQQPARGTVLAFEVDDVDATVARLRDAGVEVLSEVVDEPWGQRHAYLAAPDGVALDLFSLCPPDPAWMKANGFA